MTITIATMVTAKVNTSFRDHAHALQACTFVGDPFLAWGCACSTGETVDFEPVLGFAGIKLSLLLHAESQEPSEVTVPSRAENASLFTGPISFKGPAPGDVTTGIRW